MLHVLWQDHFTFIAEYVYMHVYTDFILSADLLAGGLAASFILQALACVHLAHTAGIQQETQWTILSRSAGTGVTCSQRLQS